MNSERSEGDVSSGGLVMVLVLVLLYEREVESFMVSERNAVIQNVKSGKAVTTTIPSPHQSMIPHSSLFQQREYMNFETNGTSLVNVISCLSIG